MSIVVTKASIRPLKGAQVRRITLAEAATAGAILAVNNVGKGAVATKNSTQALAFGRGLALANNTGGTDFAAAERVDMVVFGPVAGFSGLTPGLPVYVGNTGVVTQTATATTGEYPQEIGWAEDDGTVFVNPPSSLPVVNS